MFRWTCRLVDGPARVRLLSGGRLPDESVIRAATDLSTHHVTPDRTTGSSKLRKHYVHAFAWFDDGAYPSWRTCPHERWQPLWHRTVEPAQDSLRIDPAGTFSVLRALSTARTAHPRRPVGGQRRKHLRHDDRRRRGSLQADANGSFVELHAFDNLHDGAIDATDSDGAGSLYGTDRRHPDKCGTIFTIDPARTLDAASSSGRMARVPKVRWSSVPTAASMARRSTAERVMAGRSID